MKSLNWLRISSLLVLALAGGCISAKNVQQDIAVQRARRFQEWRAEHLGKPADRTVLSGALTLDESIRIALANSRQVEIALLEREKARARVLEAYSDALPNLALEGTYTRLDEVQSLSVPGGGDVTIGDEDNYGVNFIVTQPLYRGGEVSAGVRAARIFSMYAEEQLRGSRQLMIAQVRRGYYDVLLAIALERAAAEAVSVAERLLEDTRKAYEAGTAASFDVLRAEVELKTLIANDVQLQNRFHLAMTSLLNVLGVSQESHIVLTDELEYEPITPEVDDAVHTAFFRNTEILQAEYTERLYREAISAAKSGYFPELDAWFQNGYSKPDPHDQTKIDWGHSWSAGLTLRYTIFDGFRTLAQVRQARADYAQSQVMLRDVEERVLLQIKQALFSLDDAARAVTSQQANVEQATEAQRLVELGFREGVRKQVEVLDARQALTRAQAQYAQALYDHETARLAYEQAVGILDPVAPQFLAPELAAPGIPAQPAPAPKPAGE